MSLLHPKLKFWRRLLKMSLWLWGIFLGLIVLSYVLILIFLPADQIRQIAIHDLQQILKRQVQIKTVAINIFKGISLNQVILFESDPFKPAGAPQPPEFVHISEIRLQYRFWPLLKRRLLIDEILIDAPHVVLQRDRSGHWNFDDLLALAADTLPQPAPPDTTAFGLLFQIQLQKFKLNNLSLNFNFAGDSSTAACEFASLTGEIRDLMLPRGETGAILKTGRCNLRLLMEDARFGLHYQSPPNQQNFQFETVLNLDWTIVAQGIEQLATHGVLAIEKTRLVDLNQKQPQALLELPIIDELLRLQFEINGNGQTGHFQLLNLELKLLQQPLLVLEGSAEHIFEKPWLDLRLKKSSLDLNRIQAALAALNWPALHTLRQRMQLHGILAFEDSEIHGNPMGLTREDGLQFKTRFTLTDFNLALVDADLRIDSLNLWLNASGNYSRAGLEQLRVHGNVRSPLFKTALSDTENITFHDFSLDLKSELTPTFFPNLLELDLRIGRFWGARGDLQLHFRSNGNFKRFDLQSELNLFNFSFDNLDLVDFAGKVDLNLKLHGNTLDQLQLDLSSRLDSLMMLFETGWDPLADQKLAGSMKIKVDSTFQNFLIDPINLNLSNFLTAAGYARIREAGAAGFEIEITEAETPTQQLYDQIPPSIKTTIGALELTSKAVMQLSIKGKVPPEGIADYHGNGRVEIERMDLDYPDLFLKAWNIHAQTDFELFPDSLTGFLTATIDSFAMIDLRKAAFKDNYFEAKYALPLFLQMRIDAASFQMREINTRITATGLIDSLDTEPLMNLDAHLNFYNRTPVELMDGLKIDGTIEADAHIYLYETLMVLNSQWDLQSINLSFLDLLYAQNIKGIVPVNQKMDIELVSLLPDELPLLASANSSDLEYNYFRPYYRHLDQPIATVTIDKIKVLDYELTDGVADVIVGASQLAIPRFNLQAYEGNIQGNFWIKVGEGSFDEPEVILNATQLRMKATLSSINTARLNPVISAKAKKSLINANLALEGDGLNPEGDLAITGQFHITEIGPQVADNLLRSLDPMGADQGIQSVRTMLKTGFKARLMSFEIKHSHFYPKIVLSKPFYMPINIANGVVELARIPINIYLKQMLASPIYAE
ncbi:AsmA family protein [candidate division KSB1 bacterium]|nr:AsmA family protein [candidate division KSB1 bacterium]